MCLKNYYPRHAVFYDRDSRLATYKGVWRPDIEQTPDILTDEGFFYTGKSIDNKHRLQLIDWCLTPTFAIFQLYPGMNKCCINLRHLNDRRNKTYLSINQSDYMYK